MALKSARELALAGELPEKRASYATPPRSEKPSPSSTGVGFTGLKRFQGLVREEYVSELTGVRKVDIYTKMRSDGLIEALWLALTLPVRASAWTVETDGTDANAKKARDLVEDQLLNRLGECWESEVENLLGYGQFGFHCAAINWAVEKGEAVLKELRPLHPRTILQTAPSWDFDESGRVRGVTQNGMDGDSWKEEYIPGSALFHLVNQGNYGNPEGRSWFRSAYKHWLIRDTLYRIQAIGLERGAVGTPFVTYDHQNAAPDTEQKLLAFAQGIVVHESAGGVFPAGAKIENYSLDIQTEDIMPAIDHHGSCAALSVLAQFLMLGQEGKGGAYALSADQSDLFLQTLQTIADYICARISRKLIPLIVQYNIATDQFPKLRARIARRSAAALASLLQPLIAGNALTWSEQDEDWLREQLELPARTEKRVKPEPATPPGKKTKDGEFHDHGGCDHGREVITLAADDARRRRDEDEAEFVSVMETLLSGIRDSYLQKLKPLIRDAEDAEKIAKGKPIDELNDVAVPGRAKYLEAVGGYLWQIYREGRRAAAEETGEDLASTPISNKQRQIVKAQAERITDDHLGQMKSVVLARVLTGIRSEMPVDDILGDAKANATDALSAISVRGWAQAAQELCSGVIPSE